MFLDCSSSHLFLSVVVHCPLTPVPHYMITFHLVEGFDIKVGTYIHNLSGNC